jgi:hypothetical protein
MGEIGHVAQGDKGGAAGARVDRGEGDGGARIVSIGEAHHFFHQWEASKGGEQGAVNAGELREEVHLGPGEGGGGIKVSQEGKVSNGGEGGAIGAAEAHVQGFGES